jgi:hypothetical protein
MHLMAYGGNLMQGDPMKAFLAQSGFRQVEATEGKSCELWSNGVESVTLAIGEDEKSVYAVLEDRSMNELNLSELMLALEEPLSQTA